MHGSEVFHPTHFLLSLALLLGTARVLGEVAVRLRQPAIVGELLAGVLLGPTVLGTILPEWQHYLFPTAGPMAVALDGLTILAIVLFLLVAGLEVDLSIVWRQGRVAFWVAFVGMAIPFAIGLGFAEAFPGFLRRGAEVDGTTFSLFFATALSISALPVIAKILLDLHLFRSDFGMIIVSSAILNDLVGWLVFALVLGRMQAEGATLAFVYTVVGVLAFSALMLTAGKRLVQKLVPWIQARTSWPGGILGFALTGALAAAALTEWLGIHAIFGAFIFGVVLGDSPHLREHTRATLSQFISFIFAPLFFASIGLQVNFATHFNGWLVLAVLVLASVTKIAGCGVAAWWSGMQGQQSLALGCAMNARGAMEIVLGLLALEAGVIGEPLFVALVVMALATTVTAAFSVEGILQPQKPLRFWQCMSAKTFKRRLESGDAAGVIAELVSLLPGEDEWKSRVARAVLKREELMSTNLGSGLAVPHARVEGLSAPLVCVGYSQTGVDFDAVDGLPTQLIFLIVTPEDDHQSQIEILADIARTFQAPAMVERVLRTNTYTEFLSLLRSDAAPAGAVPESRSSSEELASSRK